VSITVDKHFVSENWFKKLDIASITVKLQREYCSSGIYYFYISAFSLEELSIRSISTSNEFTILVSEEQVDVLKWLRFEELESSTLLDSRPSDER
jgi:hypothetical protein